MSSSRVASQYKIQSRHSPFSDPSPFEDAPDSTPTSSSTPQKLKTTTTKTTTNPSTSSTAIDSIPTTSSFNSINNSTTGGSNNNTPRKQSSLNPTERSNRTNETAPNSKSISTSSSTSSPLKSSSPNKSNDKKDRITTNPSSTDKDSKGKVKPSSTNAVPFDVIDRLDISGLYGGGSFVRHDGPYAAATTSRNKGPRAPIGAFDPSALALPSASSLRVPPRSNSTSSGLSPRAAATLAAMDRGSGGMEDEKGPYGVRRPLGNRRVSESSVSMGFPSSTANEGSKAQQLIEIYGVRENEAWEDFGTSRYAGFETGSHASSKECFDKKNFSSTTAHDQSIWDIEATLRAGRPIAQAPPPPPVPILTSDINEGYVENPNYKPKRSKSLAARFRTSRKNPNNPMSDDIEEGNVSASGSASGIYDGREAGKSDFSSTGVVDESNGIEKEKLSTLGSNQFSTSHELNKISNSVVGNGRNDQNIKFAPSNKLKEEEEVLEVENGGGIRFVDNGFSGSKPLTTSKSLGGFEDSRDLRLAGSSQLGRKKSVLQRLFGGKS